MNPRKGGVIIMVIGALIVGFLIGFTTLSGGRTSAQAGMRVS